MIDNPVRWFEIYVQDMPRAKRLYESVFQVELSKLDSPALEMWAFPMLKERMGASGALAKTRARRRPAGVSSATRCPSANTGSLPW